MRSQWSTTAGSAGRTAALWLAGFSFGGVIAIRAAAAAHAARLVAVAPGINRVEVAAVPAPDCPWLIVQGDADDVVPPQAVLEWARALIPAPTLRLLPGAGHFFHGRINELRDVVLDFMGSAPARLTTKSPAGRDPCRALARGLRKNLFRC